MGEVMAKTTRPPFVLQSTYLAAVPFTFAGRTFKADQIFPWRRLSCPERRLRQLYEAKKLKYPSDSEIMTIAEGTARKASQGGAASPPESGGNPEQTEQTEKADRIDDQTEGETPADSQDEPEGETPADSQDEPEDAGQEAGQEEPEETEDDADDQTPEGSEAKGKSAGQTRKSSPETEKTDSVKTEVPRKNRELRRPGS